jgi:hypothetical protein
MKKKIIPILITAVIAIVAIAIVMRVPALKKIVGA